MTKKDARKKQVRATRSTLRCLSALPLTPDKALALRVASRMKVAQSLTKPSGMQPALLTPQERKKGERIVSDFLTRKRKHPDGGYICIFAFDDDQPLLSFAPQFLLQLSDGGIGVSFRKKIFRVESTNEYLFFDVSLPPVSKSDCILASTGSFFGSQVSYSNRFLPSAELVRNLLPKTTLRPLAVGETESALQYQRVRKTGTRRAPSLGITPVIARLPTSSMLDLHRLWQNAIRYSTDNSTTPDRREAAFLLLSAVEAEWTRRGAEGVIASEYFAWPSTDAPKAGKGSGSFEANAEGMLAYLEYRVGRTNGQPRLVRRSILDRVFVGQLPPVFLGNYMRQWGEPATSTRLRKMAESIAAFARNLKRREDDRMQQAIDSWENDLNYLFETYYVGKFGFAWPVTRLI